MERGAQITSFPCAYGKYELLKRIGSGGMAEVFLARLPGVGGFEKTVVVKRILPALSSDPRMEEAFVAEASLTAQVQHKNVVQVYELDRLENGEFFMTMEYVEGIDLARMLRLAVRRKVRIPPWLSVKILGEVLDALTYVHDLADKQGRPRNLVHRDVTPSNIFISERGDVKLGDFGVAKDFTRDTHTIDGELKGKISYMSPEQLRHQPIDRRTDIFAAGILLWECLTQRRLFGGGRPHIETMNLICHGARIPPSRVRRDVPPNLDRCTLRALQADPEARYQSARGFQTQLYDVLEDLRATMQSSEIGETILSILGKPDAQIELETGEHDLRTSSTMVEQLSGDLPPTFSKVRDPSGSSSKSGTVTHPFWARSTEGPGLGPTNYFDLLSALKRPSASWSDLSADGKNWVKLEEFAELTGQEGLLPPPAPGVGEIRGKSLIAILANAGLNETTVVLTIGGPERQGPLPAEIDLFRGRPRNVWSVSPNLQLPELLLQEGLAKVPQLPALIHESLSTGVPLDKLACQLAHTDYEAFRRRILRRRIAALIETKAEVRFSPLGETQAAPDAPSILAMLPTIVHEAYSKRGLLAALGKRIDQRLSASVRLDEFLPNFQLSQSEALVVTHLRRGLPIRAWLDEYPEFETIYLYMGMVLLESELLLAES